jgi:hypothetical protein
MESTNRLVVSATLVVAVLSLFVYLSAYPIPHSTPQAPPNTIEINGVTYVRSNISLSHCSGTPGSETGNVSASSGVFSFTMRIQSCYSPGGLTLNGTCYQGGVDSEAFLLSSRQVPNEQGYIAWFSQDGRAGVLWEGGYEATILSKSN